MSHRYTLEELAKVVQGTARGEGKEHLTGVAGLAEAGPHQVSWLNNPKYRELLAGSRAGAVLLPKDHGSTPMPAILCERLDRSIALLLGAFAPTREPVNCRVHPSAVVAESAIIGPDVTIGPHVTIEAHASIGARSAIGAGVYIGEGTKVGEDCFLWPNVVIREGCSVGNRVLIHPNAVIGADGFGFYFEDGQHHKFPHIGGVIIEDDVEIGACSCVDRSKFGNTVIGRGTKIDNLVQIGHNCQIGEHCVIAGLTGLAGSVSLGRYCVVAGRVSAFEHVVVGEGAKVAALSVLTKNVQSGSVVSGFPAQELGEEQRLKAMIRRLPGWVEEWRGILARIERLEASTHHQP